MLILPLAQIGHQQSLLEGHQQKSHLHPLCPVLSLGMHPRFHENAAIIKIHNIITTTYKAISDKGYFSLLHY